jgi:TonB-dependent receptor
MSAKAKLFVTTSFLGFCLAATPALAQQAQTPETQDAPSTSVADSTQPETSVTEDDIVVTGVRASLQGAQDIKRNSDSVVDSIVAEDIGKLPDNTVSDALQRVTGIQVQRGGGEASTVLIRGLPNIQSYINGREVFTGTFRGVALQDIPAELVAGIDVYKSATPEIVEGGVAGLIDIRFRRPFDFSDFQIAGSARGIYSDQAGKWSYIGSGLVSNTWNLANGGRLGLLIGGSFNKRRYEDQTVFNFGFSPRGNGSPAAPPRINPATGQPLLFPQTTGAIYNVGDRERPAFNASIQYSPDDNFELWVDGIFTGFREKFDVNFFIGLPGQAEAPLSGFTVQPGTNVVNTLTNLFNFTIHSKQAFLRKTDSYQFAGGGRWKFDGTTISTELVYNDSSVKSRQVVVDIGYVAPRIDYNLDNGGTPQINVVGADPASPPGPGIITLFDNRNLAKSRQWALHADLAHEFDAGVIKELKAGFRATDREGSSFGTNPSGAGIPFVAPSTLGADFLTLSPSNILDGRAGIDRFAVPDSRFILNNTDRLRALAGRPAGDPAYDPNRTFELTENTYALYAQLGFGFEGSFPIDGVIGARVVNTDTELNGTQTLNGVASAVGRSQNYIDVLPSLSLRARPIDNVQLRLVAAKSLTRPEFDQLNPATGLTQAGATIRGTGAGGNADLEPIRSNNVDATIEWYFARTGSLTLAGFYRDLEGYIQVFTAPETFPGINGQPNIFDVTRPRNTNGSLKGVELAYQQFFDFLPGPLSGFGAQANVTYIDAKADNPFTQTVEPISQVSRYSYNLVAIYEKYGLSARLAYNWRSKFIDSFTALGSVGDRIQVRSLSFLDFSASYELTSNITLSVDATNLLDEKYRDDFIPGVAPRDTRQFDRTFGFGVRARF